MKKCNLNNQVQIDNTHDIFYERVHELQDEKNLSYKQIADAIFVSEDSLKQWMRKSGKMPGHNHMISLAHFFNVDVAYLYGEQNCRKMESQRVVDLTGLSEESAKKLTRSLKGNETLNSLLSHKDFTKLLSSIYDYTHSQFVDVKTNNNALPENDTTPTVKDIKAGYRTKCLETFSGIIDSLWNDQYDSMLYMRDLNTITEMLKYIDENYETAESIGDPAKECMFEIIETYISKLEHKDFLFLKKYPPELIYDNYLDISKTLNIDLKVRDIK